MNILMISTFSLNRLFPGIFFSIENHATFSHWMIFHFMNLLDVIPVDFISPFVPEYTTIATTKPWGELLLIICKIALTVSLFMSCFLVFGSYKIKQLRKPKIDN